MYLYRWLHSTNRESGLQSTCTYRTEPWTGADQISEELECIHDGNLRFSSQKLYGNYAKIENPDGSPDCICLPCQYPSCILWNGHLHMHPKPCLLDRKMENGEWQTLTAGAGWSWQWNTIPSGYICSCICDVNTTLDAHIMREWYDISTFHWFRVGLIPFFIVY
jgi:hypothetical protein